MNEKRLIVNADDFARSAGVNAGILRAHQDGIVTTTTAMMNIDGACEAVLSAHGQCPALGVGVHLNITYGRPLSHQQRIPTLLTSEGLFCDFRELLAHPETISVPEVEREWRLQIETFLETAIPLDHLDSHHHSAVFSAELFELLLTLASEYGCGVRNPKPADLPTHALQDLYSEGVVRFVEEQAGLWLDQTGTAHPDVFLASFFAEQATAAHLDQLLKGIGSGVHELMCHPGILDARVAMDSSYAGFREQELRVLTAPAVQSRLERNQIKLHTYRTAWME